MVTITIDPELCKHDGICVAVCPEAVFLKKDKDAVPDPVHTDLCISCGQCAAVCPAGALSHSAFPEGWLMDNKADPMPSYEQLIALMRNRRSHRSFKNKPVEEEVIRKIIDAARYAPTAYNSQGTKYLVIKDILQLTRVTDSTADFMERMMVRLRESHGEEALLTDHTYPIGARIVSEVRSGSDMVLHNAPALMIFYADRHDGMGGINANLAIQNAALAAESLGVGAFYTGYVLFACRQENELNKIMGIPEGHDVHGGLALGYPKVKFRRWIERKPANITWR
jgi:nitroreductase/NAD-dependent dihydropyrimidine dehydrogenase PreA subunit